MAVWSIEDVMSTNLNSTHSLVHRLAVAYLPEPLPLVWVWVPENILPLCLLPVYLSFYTGCCRFQGHKKRYKLSWTRSRGRSCQGKLCWNSQPLFPRSIFVFAHFCQYVFCCQKALKLGLKNFQVKLKGSGPGRKVYIIWCNESVCCHNII